MTDKEKIDRLSATVRHLCEMIAPTVKSESRLSQGLGSALGQARSLLRELGAQ